MLQDWSQDNMQEFPVRQQHACNLVEFLTCPFICLVARWSAAPCYLFTTARARLKSGWLTSGKPRLFPTGRNWPTEHPGWRATEKMATFLDSIVWWTLFHPCWILRLDSSSLWETPWTSSCWKPHPPITCGQVIDSHFIHIQSQHSCFGRTNTGGTNESPVIQELLRQHF